jgi:hypothetical protein
MPCPSLRLAASREAALNARFSAAFYSDEQNRYTGIPR